MNDRYWVGGAGVPSSTTHWALTSGGTPGASVPGATNDVHFDENSATGNYTVTVTTTVLQCRNLTITDPSGGALTVNKAGIESIYANGDVSISAATTLNLNLHINTNTTASLALNDCVMNGQLEINSSSGTGTVIFASDITATHINAYTGGLATADYAVTVEGNITAGTIVAGINISFGASIITCVRFDMSVYSVVDYGTSEIRAVNFVGNYTRSYTDAPYDIELRYKPGTDTELHYVSNCHNLTISNDDVESIAYIMSHVTVSNNFTAVGGSAGKRIRIFPYSTYGHTNITCNGTVTIENFDCKGFQFLGTATWAGTSIGDMGGNLGMTFTAPRTLYWVHGASEAYSYVGGGRWSLTSGGTVGEADPLPQDTVIFDENSFATTGKVVNIDGTQFEMLGHDVSFAAVTNNPELHMTSESDGIMAVCGNFVLSPNMTITNAADHNGSIAFLQEDGETINTAGLELPFLVYVLSNQAEDGSVLASDLTCRGIYVGYLDQAHGAHFDTAGYTINAGFFLHGSYTTEICDNSAINITPIYNANTVLNFYSVGGPYPSSFVNTTFTITATGGITEAGINVSYDLPSIGNLVFAGTALAITVRSYGATTALKMEDLRLEGGEKWLRLNLTSGESIGMKTLTPVGGPDVIHRIEHYYDVNGTRAQIRKIGTGIIECDYMEFKHILGLNAKKWYVGANSIDAGDNAGLYFEEYTPPVPGVGDPGAFFKVMHKS